MSGPLPWWCQRDEKLDEYWSSCPPDALWSEGHGLSLPWIVENWAKWIYPECPVEEVLILPNYEIDGAEEFPLIV